MSELTIILPEQNLEGPGEKLVYLTEQLSKVFDTVAYGVLGGEFGYGAEYENDVFMMKPYCWCDKPDCAWCVGCTCEGYWEDESNLKGYVETFTCDYHAGKKILAPNFLYKPTGWKVNFYKYIGRNMEYSGKEPKGWLEACLQSLKKVS